MPTAGMIVETRTEALVAYRRSVVELLARPLPGERDRRGPGQGVPSLARRLRPVAGRCRSGGRRAAGPVASLHPRRHVALHRLLPLRAHLRRGAGPVRLAGLGPRRRRRAFVPDGPTLLESSCVSCGACVDTCPTGRARGSPAVAAPSRRPPGRARPARTAASAARCESGRATARSCRSGPVLDAPVNKGHLCVKGRYAFDFVDAPDRITAPLIREADGWRPVVLGRGDRRSWPTRLQAIVARHGPDAVGVLGSARATNEENYLAQKFARVVHRHQQRRLLRARLSRAERGRRSKPMLGAGAATNSFDDIELARTILVCGANATENHPVVGRADPAGGAARREPHRRSIRGASSWPRQADSTSPCGRARTCRCSTRWPTSSSTEGLVDDAFLAARVDGLDEFRAVRSRRGRRSAPRTICGVEAAAIRRRGAAVRDRDAGDERPRAGRDRARAGHRRRDGARQPRAAHRQHRRPGARRQPAARPEQRAGRGAHGLRARHADRRSAAIDRGRARRSRRSGALRCRRRRGLHLLGDDGRGERRPAQGALGDRLRRLPDQPARGRRPRGRSRRSSCSSSRTSS